MRLSLTKGAHAVISSAACRKSGHLDFEMWGTTGAASEFNSRILVGLKLVPQVLVIHIVMELNLGNLDQITEQPRASVRRTCLRSA